MSHNITVESGKSVRLKTAGKYCDRDIVVTAEGGGGDTDAAFEAGRKAEYDAFWDAFQENGERSNYAYGFSGDGWCDENFKPKYDIRPTFGDTTGIFRQSRIVDLKQCLESCGVVLDFSLTSNVVGAFVNCTNLKVLPKIDISACTGSTNMFNGATALETIEELKVAAKTGFSNTFLNCKSLKHMIVTGTIAQNGFDVSRSPLLDEESITSIVNALSSTTSGLSITLSLMAVDNAFSDAEFDALENTKRNWTINLT